MDNQTIPTLEEVQAHFKCAKDIKCLNLNSVINISYAKEYFYIEEKQGYFAKNGIVCFWKLGLGFAEIINRKCNGCKKFQNENK